MKIEDLIKGESYLYKSENFIESVEYFGANISLSDKAEYYMFLASYKKPFVFNWKYLNKTETEKLVCTITPLWKLLYED